MEVENASATRIQKDRSCRDVLFLIFFIAFWVGMFIAAGIGLSQGDPRLLIYGTDYEGNLCGIDNSDNDRTPGNHNLEDFKFRYWPNVLEIYENAKAGFTSRAHSLCLEKCPHTGYTSDFNWVCDYPTNDNGAPEDMVGDLQKWKEDNYNYFNQLNKTFMESSLSFEGPCFMVLLNSSSAYWSCQYVGGFSSAQNLSDSKASGINAGELEESMNEYLSEPIAVMQRYVADLELGWLVIVIAGMVMPVVLSFLWLILIRYVAGLFAWIVLITLNVFTIACTVMTAIKAGLIGDDQISAVAGEAMVDKMETESGVDLDASEYNQSVLKACTFIMIVVCILVFLFTMVMIPRIKIAVKVLQVAGRAVMATPTVILFPLTTFISLALLIAYWMVVAVYLYSSGDVVANTDENGEPEPGFDMSLDKNLQYMLLYHFFGLLWGMQFILAFGQLVIAGAIADYYWTRGEGSGEVSPVLSSVKRAAWYHCGSVAFGSFIIAVFEFVRAVLKYIETKCKEATAGDAAAGQVIKFFFCCIQCCLAIMECIMKFINRNAYIVIAVDGSSYCTAVMRAVKLLMANILRVAVVNVVGDAILFIGKLAIAFGSSFIAYLYLDSETYKSGDNAVSSPILIVVLVFLSAWSIASAFMSVTEMAVDTVLMSYCIDCDENNGRAPNAPPALNDTLDAAEETMKKKDPNKATEA